ncbi:MAG: XrtA/PEP-CTERM system histidine kinase PrsK [Gammaproteobacteria bacterium]
MPVGALTNGAAAFAFLVLAAILSAGWRGRIEGGLLVFAAALSALWAGFASYEAMLGDVLGGSGARMLETLRNAAWLLFLSRVLRLATPRDAAERNRFELLHRLSWLLPLALFALLVLDRLTGPAYERGGLLNEFIGPGHLLLAVLGLVMVEQVYRNARSERRWGVKYLCLGLVAIWAFDFYLHADAVLFRHVDERLVAARGLINVLAVPMIVVAAARNPQWSLDVFVSRQMVFYSATMVGAGGYLVLTAIAGYYLRSFGGSWAVVVQVTFVFAALLGLLAIVSSGQLRSKAKVFFSKHFFNYKYDYREEWLRFIRTVTGEDSDLDLGQRAIKAMGQIVESPAGVLWLRGDGGQYRAASAWNSARLMEGAVLEREHPLPRFLADRQWVVDVREYREHPDMYGELKLPDWCDARAIRFVVPLMLERDLLGFIALSPPRAQLQFNFEDADLLKTVGRQLAGALAQEQADRALTEARQFEALTRLSTYVVHDLKNTVAQLALMVGNAERHKDNPAFVEDMVKTVDNAVGRMKRMLEQLRSGHTHRAQSRVDVHRVAQEVIAARSVNPPAPVLDSPGEGLIVMANRERFAAVLANLIQNAQEATRDDGEVRLRVRPSDDRVIVEVIDNGQGMDARFVRERLFRPFDTTKGNSGMGIGVYEARELARGMGGDLVVDTQPGVGTTMSLRLPRAD